jgi:hypothetical protein
VAAVTKKPTAVLQRRNDERNEIAIEVIWSEFPNDRN